MIGKPRVVGVAGALLLVEEDVLLVVLVEGPLRGAPMHRRHEVIVARGDHLVGFLGETRALLAAARGRFEGRADIGHLLDALADRGEIGERFDAARRLQIERARLVPIDAVRLDDVVDRPALLAEAAAMRLADMLDDRLRMGSCSSSYPPFHAF